MEKIPTAEAWLKHFEENAYPGTSISECMIDFAKLHVEQALKEASEKAETKIKMIDYVGVRAGGQYEDKVVDKESILNSYPLEKIK
jgi:hypothetical protein